VELVVEVKLTVVKVQSDEAEGVLMDSPVLTHVLPGHEATVGLDEKLLRLAGVGVNPESRAPDPANTHMAVEIGDRGRFVGADGGEMVDKERFVPDDDGLPTGNGPRRDVVAGERPARPQETGAEGSAGNPGATAQELTAGHGRLRGGEVSPDGPAWEVVV
jgi:hypothetical protein